jgi:gamma-glutamyl-gamma-aminobutyraldehyde dehydrogenase
MDTAVQYAVNGIYGNQGEVCNAGSRLLVQRHIADDFSQRFTTLAREAYRAGDPLDPATTLGALVNSAQQERVLDYIDIGRREGAQVAMGGGVPKQWEHGAYVEPTLFTGVNNDMRIAREEIFGPVCAVIPFDTPADAVRIANDSIYGLAASVWTGNLGTAHRMARDIEAGVIWVNCFDHGDMTQPWGGYKQSGNGRDKCFESIVAHTQSKSVWVHLGED